MIGDLHNKPANWTSHPDKLWVQLRDLALVSKGGKGGEGEIPVLVCFWINTITQNFPHEERACLA